MDQTGRGLSPWYSVYPVGWIQSRHSLYTYVLALMLVALQPFSVLHLCWALESLLLFLIFCVTLLSQAVNAVAYREGGLGGSNPPRNSEVLTKLSRIPCSVENTSVTV
jgi:hypothetical protein